MSRRQHPPSAPLPDMFSRKALVSSQGQPNRKRKALPVQLGTRITIPDTLRNDMNQWGPQMRKELASLAPGATLTFGDNGLRVGTDCSGLEVPLLALRALGISHQHVFSCEIKAKTRRYIEMNFGRGTDVYAASMFEVYPDMLRRDNARVPEHDLYVCGFPCQPFSSLNGKSSGFREKQARPFFKMLRTVEACLPALAILENVPGIHKHIKQVWRHFRALKWYEVLTCLIDPADMGEPVSRPRYYFILVRTDVARLKGSALHDLASKLSEMGCRPRETRRSLTSRLLPNYSPVVRAWVNKQREGNARKERRKSTSDAARVGQPPKWIRLHAGQREACGEGAPTETDGASSREKSLFGILLAAQQQQQRQQHNTQRIVQSCRNVVDLSQGLGRARFLQDACPTVTPGARIWVTELGRFMVPMEKILIHMIPVHDLDWPSDLSDNDIMDLGGNTMHAMAAGALVFFVSEVSMARS